MSVESLNVNRSGDDSMLCTQCRDTEFIPEDDETVCHVCREENARDDAADNAYDMEVEG